MDERWCGRGCFVIVSLIRVWVILIKCKGISIIRYIFSSCLKWCKSLSLSLSLSKIDQSSSSIEEKLRRIPYTCLSIQERTNSGKKKRSNPTPFKLNVCSSWLINSKIVHLFGRAISRGMASFRSELIASGRFSRPRSAWLDTKDYDLRQQTLRWPGRGGNRSFEERKEFQFRYLWVSWNFVSKGFYPYR